MVPDVTSQPPQAIPVDDAVSELARKTYKKSTFFLMQLYSPTKVKMESERGVFRKRMEVSPFPVFSRKIMLTDA